jgi:hypothetical protein
MMYLYAAMAGAAFLAGLVFGFRKSAFLFRSDSISAWGTIGRWLLVLLPLLVLASLAVLSACGIGTCPEPRALFDALIIIAAPATFVLAVSSIVPFLPMALVGGAIGALAARVYVWAGR